MFDVWGLPTWVWRGLEIYLRAPPPQSPSSIGKLKKVYYSDEKCKIPSILDLKKISMEPPPEGMFRLFTKVRLVSRWGVIRRLKSSIFCVTNRSLMSPVWSVINAKLTYGWAASPPPPLKNLRNAKNWIWYRNVKFFSIFFSPFSIVNEWLGRGGCRINQRGTPCIKFLLPLITNVTFISSSIITHASIFTKTLQSQIISTSSLPSYFKPYKNPFPPRHPYRHLNS